MEILKYGAGSQIPRLSNLLPEDLNRDITTWVCFTKVTTCGFKWLICTQVSLAIYRWPCVYVCVCVCVSEYAHACVYNYGSPSAEQETFLFGKAICWNRPAPFILSIITMQEKTKRKNDIQEKRKGERDKWRSTARHSMSGTTLHCKIDISSWSKQEQRGRKRTHQRHSS